MKLQIIFLTAMAICGLLLVGCDIGVNPLVFDGSPLSATFNVNTEGTVYAGADTVNLTNVLSKISEDIDSIEVINISIQAVNTGSTPTGTHVTGTAMFDGDTLFTVNNVALSTLATEQSIFAMPANSLTLNQAGVNLLRNEVKDIQQNPGSPHIVTVGVAGYSTGSPLQMQITFRIYTQVFTKPKK